MIIASDFEIFLKNSQNTFIKKLLIKNQDDEDILPYIKEYIMKRKRVKYLAIKNTFFKNTFFNNNVRDFFSLKDEVKEFESNDIQVLYYNDLHIQVIDFIKEMD